MRTLHVAAMPFPTHQGTQALLHAMLSALADAGHDTHLVCYGHGAFERSTPYRVHRLAPPRSRSLRSGPSLAKVAQDALLARQLPALIRRLQPELVVAHHVEAGVAALLASSMPVLLVAHTSLSAELASYFPAPLRLPCVAAGRALDSLLCRKAAHVAAVSPLLAERLSGESNLPIQPLQLPWSVPPALEPHEAGSARRALELSPDDQVVLYAGNLDAYQGLSVLARGIAVLSETHPRLRWLVATESLPAQLAPLLGALGLAGRVRFCSLAGESQRRALHAAADVVVVPRQCPGGIPVKLLDALARGVPVVAPRRALAGLQLEPLCRVIDDDDAQAFCHALEQLLRDPAAALHMAHAARDHLQRAHRSDQFAADFLRHAETCLRRTSTHRAARWAFFWARSANDMVAPGRPGSPTRSPSDL